MASGDRNRGQASAGRENMTGAGQRYVYGSVAFALLAILLAVVSLPSPALSQSGRQKGPTPSPTPAASTRARQTTKPKTPPAAATDSPKPKADDADAVSDEVVRVSSHLVPVPTTVVTATGKALTNLRLEDFELEVDGQPKPISDISRSETPVRMAMLFDNSGS